MEKTTEKNEPKPFHVEMQKLNLAINMIDLAQRSHMSKEEIVETTELIRFLLNEKATAATVTSVIKPANISRLYARLDALEREDRKFKNKETSEDHEYKKTMESIKVTLDSTFY